MLREAYGVKRIIIRTGKTDLRYGIDKLSALVSMEFGLDPLDAGTLFLFCGKKRDMIKGLVYEGDGFLLLTKRLTNGASSGRERKSRRGRCPERIMGGLWMAILWSRPSKSIVRLSNSR